MNNSYFYDLLLKNDLKVDEDLLEKFELFKYELIQWNNKINLTRITEENDIYLKHFFDSLQIAKYINQNDKVIDVGTGAGFPGLPLKIYFPNLDITLLDSVNKKIIYLEDIVKKLALKKVNLIHGRAEDIGQDNKYREKFDVAVSRAVANMTTLSEYLMPLVKKGGRIICMKGSNLEEELEQSKKAIKLLGGEIEEIEEYELPNTEIKYHLVIIKKIEKTPSKYPRKSGLPTSKPLI